jgi:hypothetical protein
MKRLLLLPIITLFFGCETAPVASNHSPMPSVAARPPQSGLSGEYNGKWTSSEGTGGELRIKLDPNSATSRAEAMFTYEGAEIPGTVKTIETNGSKIRMVFDWSIQGTAGQSTLIGEASGATLQGTFETKGVAGASRGTWSVTRG